MILCGGGRVRGRINPVAKGEYEGLFAVLASLVNYATRFRPIADPHFWLCFNDGSHRSQMAILARLRVYQRGNRG